MTMLRLQIAGLIALAFVLGALKLRADWTAAALARARSERDTLRQYRRTRQEVDDVPHGDDPALARRWLHERQQGDRP